MNTHYRRVITAALILSLLQAPTALLASPSWFGTRNPAHRPLSQPERAAHALNRLTFGATPGDLARVQAIGAKKWIEMQLNPERIDDSALETRLQNYPAMRLSQSTLLQAYPSAAVIRAVGRRQSSPAEQPAGTRHLPEPGICLRREAKRRKRSRPRRKMPPVLLP